MDIIKYTKDRKKVRVIDSLINGCFLVQEIYVTDEGREIAQGNAFVVNELFDEPCKTFRELSLDKLEASYDDEYEKWNRKIKNITEERTLAYKALESRVKWLKNIAKEPREEEFKKAINRISSFMTNEDKWVVVRNYNKYILSKFNEDGVCELFDKLEDRYGVPCFKSMRLLSLYGNCDGSLEFRVSEYSDGSGSETPVMFFSSKKKALEFLQKTLDEKEQYCDTDICFAKEYGLKLNNEKVKDLLMSNKENVKKRIAKENEIIKSYEAEIEEIDNKINQLKNGQK